MTSEPTVRERILAAGLAGAETHGLSRLSMGEVAKRAGVSRQTVYKYFPAKESLIAAVVENETTGLIAQVVDAAQGLDDPACALEAALMSAMRAAREHPLLDRLLQTEPEILLPLLTGRESPVLAQIRAVAQVVVELRLPDLDPVLAGRFTDLLSRLLISFAVNPPDEPPEAIAQSVALLLTAGSTTVIGDRTAADVVDPTL